MFLDFKERIGVMGYDSYYLELVWFSSACSLAFPMRIRRYLEESRSQT